MDFINPFPIEYKLYKIKIHFGHCSIDYITITS